MSAEQVPAAETNEVDIAVAGDLEAVEAETRPLDPEGALDPVDCHRFPGVLPLVDIEQFPVAGTAGAESPEAALARDHGVQADSVRPYLQDPDAPVWMVVGDETYVARRHPDGGWFAASATFLGCKSFEELGL